MCGICGQYNYAQPEPVNELDIVRMTETIVHRGPDDEGYYIKGPLGLGFRRLSIIDLSGGHQPMTDQAETIWVIFNGEIYNYPELRTELESCGHVFRTKSDTEVLVHGYKQWGVDVLNHLKGMFGLSIWDDKKKKLVIARDAMGIKLIYYKIQNNRIYFGSEIRPLLVLEKNKPELDIVALNLFLRYRYTPSPLTIYKGINKLAPGTMIVIENGECVVKRWYQYKPEPFSPIKSTTQAREELLELYKKAVKRHLLSDVPVGLLLSGGIDSGLLLGLMNLQGESWPTFTVGYGKSFKDDELVDAAKTAEIFSSKHESVNLTRETFEKSLPMIVSCLEEPIATSSVVPMYFVCERARQDVKVALVGQGPDELYGGYFRHLGLRYSPYWRKLPSIIRKILTHAIQALPRNETLKRGVYSLDIPDRMQRYQQVFSIMPETTIDGLFKDGILPLKAGDTVLECWKELEILMENTDELGGLQFLELRSSLPDELLMYADKLSMAHGLELRVPFLDKDVVEFTERLTAEYKIRRGTRKWLHRKVCSDFLPASILKRKKRGFAVNVVDDWFHSSLGDKMDSYLMDSNSMMYQYLQPQPINHLLKEHKSGINNNHKLLFSLIVFEEWLRSM